MNPKPSTDVPQPAARLDTTAHACQCRRRRVRRRRRGTMGRWLLRAGMSACAVSITTNIRGAGEPMLRALVLRHHQRLYESPLRTLFPADSKRFLAGVTRAADYAVETSGGPKYFTLASRQALHAQAAFSILDRRGGTRNLAGRVVVGLRRCGLSGADSRGVLGLGRVILDPHDQSPHAARSTARYPFRDVPSHAAAGVRSPRGVRNARGRCARCAGPWRTKIGRKRAMRDETVQEADLRSTRLAAADQCN